MHGWLNGLELKALYLDLGSNDLCDPHASPFQIAEQLISLARFLLCGYKIGTVVIGQITMRLHEPFVGYNAKVATANAALRQLSAGFPGITFSTLRGLRNPYPSRFLPDGIHFNAHGNDKYVQGIRGTFIRVFRGCM